MCVHKYQVCEKESERQCCMCVVGVLLLCVCILCILISYSVTLPQHCFTSELTWKETEKIALECCQRQANY